jgi:hypothetical protein
METNSGLKLAGGTLGSPGRVFATGSEGIRWGGSFGQPRLPKALNQQLRI